MTTLLNGQDSTEAALAADSSPLGADQGIFDSRKLGAIAAALALLPLLVLLVRSIGANWFPAGDNAILVLQTAFVGTGDTTLLGPYSRYGWNHPGPLMFYLLAAPYRLAGSNPWGVLAGVVLLNIACFGAMLHLFWKFGRALLASVAALCTTIACLALTPYVLNSPWNPDLTLAPLALFVACAWVARIDLRWFPAAVAVGTFLVQSHAGFAPIVGLLCVWSLLRIRLQRPTRKTILITAAVFVICWTPVLIDQLFKSNNISELVEFFSKSELEQVGLKESLGIAARELVGIAPWMGGPLPSAPGGIETRPLIALVIPLTAYAIAVTLCRSAARRFENPRHFSNLEMLVHTTALAVVTSTLAVSRITDGAAYYLIQFWKPIAMLFWVAIATAVVSSLAKQRFQKIGTVAVVIVTAGFSIKTISEFRHAEVPAPLIQSAMSATFPTVVNEMKGERAVHIEGYGINAGWVVDALSLQLEQKGIPFLVDSSQAHKVGSDHTGARENASAAVVIATGEGIDQVADHSDLKPLVTWDGLADAREESKEEVRILQGPPNERWIIYERVLNSSA